MSTPDIVLTRIDNRLVNSRPPTCYAVITTTQVYTLKGNFVNGIIL